MEVDKYTKSYTVPDGVLKGVVFTLFCYRRMDTQTAIELVNELEPQTAFVNKKTKEWVYEKPDALTRAENKAAAMKIAVKSDWETRDLWSDAHRCFVICDSATWNVQYPDTPLAVEGEAFRDYWLARSGDVLENWRAFKLVIGQNVNDAWWKAYKATRDVVLPASPGLTSEVAEDAGDEEKNDEPAPSLVS